MAPRIVLLALLAWLLPAVATAQPAGTRLRDCRDCPELVVVPAGTFVMGAPETDGESTADERPQHEVRVPSFALGRTHVTRAEFARFVAATRHEIEPGCWHPPEPPHPEGHGPWDQSPQRNWRNPGFPQTAADPVVCVSHVDATAYAAWLAQRTRQRYRLPSEAEWEYVARAGPIGTRALAPGETCRLENGGDLAWARAMRFGRLPQYRRLCSDGYAYTAPGGRFRANAFGVHDMLGNALHWLADCYHESYAGAPADGSAWLEGGPRWVNTGECRFQVLRGNAWASGLGALRLSARGSREADYRSIMTGFRVARALAR